MSEAAEREGTLPEGNSSQQTNEVERVAAEPRDDQPPAAVLNDATDTLASDDLFLGAGVCQTPPQSVPSPLELPDYVPLISIQQRTDITGAYPTNGFSPLDVPLELPLAQAVGGTSSGVPGSETPGWRREDGSVLPLNSSSPYVYTRPSTHMPSGSMFPFQAPSAAGSGVLNATAPGLHQGMGLGDVIRSVRTGPCSACTSQGLQRSGRSRRDEIYRLSQNPWGPNTVFGPRSIPTDMHSWQIRNGDHSYESDCAFHSDGTLPYHLMRKDEQPFSMYSKYRGRHGVVRKVRKKIVDVGGKLCQSFLVWVLFVATLAGVEGFKEKSGSLSNAGLDGEWSDSEADSENDTPQKFNVLSFKG